MKTTLRILFGFTAIALLATGCAQKADVNKSIDQIKTEVEKMSVKDLQGYAQAYAKQISVQKTEAEKLLTKMRSMPPKDLLGEKAKSLRDDVSKVQSKLSALTARFDLYVKKFKEKGGDIANLKLK